jgi:DNA repair protein RadC
MRKSAVEMQTDLIDKYFEAGYDGLSDVEILSILLRMVYSINGAAEVGKKLIRDFGSLENVLSATYSQLRSLSYLSETAATLLSYIINYTEYFNLKKNFELRNREFSPQTANAFCRVMTEDCGRNESRILYFNSNLRFISFQVIAIDNMCSVQFDLRNRNFTMKRIGAVSVMIVHIHPDGSLTPTQTDLRVTWDAWNMTKLFNYNLLDHVIVTKDKCESLRYSNYIPEIWKKR